MRRRCKCWLVAEERPCCTHSRDDCCCWTEAHAPLGLERDVTSPAYFPHSCQMRHILFILFLMFFMRYINYQLSVIISEIKQYLVNVTNAKIMMKIVDW